MNSNNSTTAKELGYTLFSDKLPQDKERINYWHDGEKEGTFDAVDNIVVEHGRLPKMWKPIKVESHVDNSKEGWEISYDNDEFGQWFEVGPAKIYFPYNYDNKQKTEAEANARLIAEAPNMYRFIKNLHDRLNQTQNRVGGSSSFGDTYHVMWEEKSIGETMKDIINRIDNQVK